jgi:hypothetical protein
MAGLASQRDFNEKRIGRDVEGNSLGLISHTPAFAWRD